MKQTAVEWLAHEINKMNVSNDAKLFISKLEKQAKEMEKQQIMDAWITTADYHSSEQYYNETFKSE